MAREREVKVTVLGEDKGASRALKNVADSADRTSKSSFKARDGISVLTHAMIDDLGPAGKKIQTRLDDMGESALQAGSKLSTKLAVGAGIAGAAIGALAIKGVADFMRLAGEVDSVQDTMGGTAEEASKLRNISNALGVETDALAGSFVKLSQNIDKGKLASWGVEVAKNKDGTTDLFGTLLNLSEAYNSIEDPVQRNILVTDAFGKSGAALIDILEQGREKLKALGGIGPIFSQKELDRARELRIEAEVMKQRWEEFSVTMGSRVLGALSSASQGMHNFGESIKKSKENANPLTAVLGDVWKNLTGQRFAQDDAGKAAEAHARAQADLKIKLDDAAKALDEQTKALDKLLTASLGVVSGQLALERTTNSYGDRVVEVTEKENELTAALATYGEGSKEAQAATTALRDAKLGVREAALSAAAAALKLRDDEAALNGTTLTAQERQDIFRGKLQELANQAQGPSRDAILALAGEIRRLPAEKLVRIRADTGPAYDAVVDFGNWLGDYVASRAAVIPIQASFGVPGRFGRASGGPVSGGGMYLVGEKGPEILTMGPGANGYVTPNDRVRAMASGGPIGAWSGGGGAVHHTTVINLDGREVWRATERYATDDMRRKGLIA